MKPEPADFRFDLHGMDRIVRMQLIPSFQNLSQCHQLGEPFIRTLYSPAHKTLLRTRKKTQFVKFLSRIIQFLLQNFVHIYLSFSVFYLASGSIVHTAQCFVIVMETAAEVEVKKKMTLMTFITNNFDWSPVTVCELYRARWGIEVFFKELKQTLQLADFMGYNENAVRWQIWTGLLAYLLLRFIAWKKQWKHTFSRLYTLIRSVLLNYFDLTSIIQSCDTIGRRGPKRIRGAPELAYQMLFDFE